MTPRRLALGFALLLVPLARPARADYEETEYRLKIAGIEPQLRERIHLAIDRGVAWLAAHQRPNGSWNTATDLGSTFEVNVDHTVLAACALRHAGTPAAKRAFRDALAWLVPTGSGGRARFRDYVYTAAFMQMALAADGSHPLLARAIRDDVRASLGRKSGYWGYWLRHDGARQSVHKELDVANLSTTQFGALALWAGDRAVGAEGSLPYWQRHLEALIHWQLPDGSWSYAPTGSSPTGYANGTFMGLANLVLAREALRDVLLRRPELMQASDRALSLGIAAFHRDAASVLDAVEGRGARGWAYRGWSYYGLYALEKTATFLGWEEVGGRRWYETGASILLDLQEADGHWGSTTAEGWQAMGNNPHVATVFALLFLLRSSETYRPTTPRRPDAARGPISGGGAKRSVPEAGSGEPPSGSDPPSGPPAPGGEDPTAPDAPAEPEAAPPPEPEPADAGAPDTALAALTALAARAETLERRVRGRRTDAAELIGELRAVVLGEQTLVLPPPEPGLSLSARNERWRRVDRLVTSITASIDAALTGALVLHPPAEPGEDARTLLRATAAKLLSTRTRPGTPTLRRGIERALLDPDDVALSMEGWRTVLGVLAARRDSDGFAWIADELVRADSRPARVARTRGALAVLRDFGPVPGELRREAFERILRHFLPVERATPTGAREDLRQQALEELWDAVGSDVVTTLRAIATDPVSGERPTVVPPAGGRGGLGRMPAGTLRDLETWWRDHDDPAQPPWRDT